MGKEIEIGRRGSFNELFSSRENRVKAKAKFLVKVFTLPEVRRKLSSFSKGFFRTKKSFRR